jgi:RimJ/RimL family protein N-acetyltransferase
VLRPTYPIQTRRLILRPYAESDFDALYAIQSHADVVKYLYWEQRTHQEVEDALRERLTMTSLENEGDAIQLAVVLAETGVQLGGVMLRWVSEEHQCGEIGYVFHPDNHGKGYAGEAATEMLRLGFDDMGLHRIIGRIDADNRSSGRLLERLGMRFEGRFRENEFVKGRWCDEAVYAMLAHEWRELHDY